MKILYMGTPDFAVPCLQALIDAGHDIIGVFTQPDRPKGRGHKLTPPPVKELAIQNGLAVYQPEKIKAPEVVAQIIKLAADVIVTVAFGQLLSSEILAAPRYGCINLHASLLPKYRGAAPIHWSIINGEKETGVSTMYMSEGLDAGDIILQTTLPIDIQDTVGMVHDKMTAIGSQLLVDTLAQIADGAVTRLKQDESKANYAPLLKKEHELIHWQRQAVELHNQVRGMNPWPGAYTLYNGKILKIWSTRVSPGEAEEKPGTIVDILPQEGFVIATGQGLLLITELQLQGSKRMSATNFRHGNIIEKGIVLGQ